MNASPTDYVIKAYRHRVWFRWKWDWKLVSRLTGDVLTDSKQGYDNFESGVMQTVNRFSSATGVPVEVIPNGA